MKRGTPDHPKTEALADALGVDLAKAVGTLELLWHFAAKFAPQGDVGKWGDDAIAKAVRWSDKDGEACALVRALVTTRWLDECSERRLLIHDWDDHADDSTKKNLRRKNLEVFKPVQKASRQRRKMSRHVQTLPEKFCLPEPSLAKPSHSPSYCSEPDKPASVPPEPVYLEFPCVGPGPKAFSLTEAKVAEYQECYPGVDVRAECRAAKQWCVDTPTKRKTHDGMPRFLNTWLKYAQNKGGSPQARQQQQRPIPRLPE